jgi:hypothetical protein
MVVKDFNADMLPLIQGINAGKENENAEQYPVHKPTPEERPIEDISGGYINDDNGHNHKNQITEDFAAIFSGPIDQFPEFI